MRTLLEGIFGSTFQARPRFVSISGSLSDIKRSQRRHRYLGLMFGTSLALFAAACGGGSGGGSGSGSSDGTSSASSGTGAAVVPTPVTTLTETFSKTTDNYVAGAVSSFGFTLASSVDSSTFACSLSNGGVVTAPACTASYTASVTAPAVGAATTYTLTPTATSPAGKVEASPVTYTWIEQNYKTLALYHLYNSAPTTDSSIFTSTLQSPLTQNGSSWPSAAAGPTSSIATFPNVPTFDTTHTMSASDAATHSLARQAMTLEGFFNFSSLPAVSEDKAIVLASKTGTSGSYGWEFGLLRHDFAGTRFNVYFFVSTDKSTRTLLVSDTITSMSTAQYYHLAMTWNYSNTTASFYKDGVAIGSATLSAVNTPIADNAVPLRLGFDANASSGTSVTMGGTSFTTLWFAGNMAEVRWSQVVRTIAVPSAVYTAD